MKKLWTLASCKIFAKVEKLCESCKFCEGWDS